MRDLGGHSWGLLLAVAQSPFPGQGWRREQLPAPPRGFFALRCSILQALSSRQIHDHGLTPALGSPWKASNPRGGSNSPHLHTQQQINKIKSVQLYSEWKVPVRGLNAVGGTTLIYTWNSFKFLSA